MRKAHVAVSTAFAVAFFAVTAGAQQDTPPSTPRHYKAQPLNLRKEQLGADTYASAARSRIKNGDCEGALDALDAAIRTSDADPTLFRDRGLCHEKLGHPYPAIDDYRVYLTDVPEALDADGIRKRLVKLEDETSGRAPTTASSDDTDVPPVDTSVSGSAGGATPASVPPRDKMSYVESDDDQQSSPLRRGKGLALAPTFGVRKWFFSGSSFGDSQTWSECIGVELRYSLNAHGAILGELAYERFNSTNADAYTVSGLSSSVSYEFRVPIDPRYDNQVFVAPGVGYDYAGFVPTNSSVPSTSASALVPRVRLGYRHAIEASAAIDLSLDVGLSKWFVASGEGAPALPTTALVALNVGVLWGL